MLLGIFVYFNPMIDFIMQFWQIAIQCINGPIKVFFNSLLIVKPQDHIGTAAVFAAVLIREIRGGNTG